MGVGGDEGGICYVGPPAEAEPTVAEGSKGEGGADGVEGVGERRESADDAEQGTVINGLGAVESVKFKDTNAEPHLKSRSP